MKIFTKTALACAMAAGAIMASAETVEIRDASGDVLVTYSSNSVTVEGGVVTLSNGTYLSGYIPGIIQGTEGYACGENTTADDVNGVCVGTGGGGANCGPGTELNQAEDQCVPATPPTLNISSNTNSMGDGVTTATITFQFSRNVTGFTQGDVNVSPSSHSLSGFNAVDGDTFRATLNRSGNSSGTVNITVGNGSYDGDNGAAGTGDSHSINLVGGTTTVGNCEVPDNVELTNHDFLAGWDVGGNLNEYRIPNGKIVSHKIKTGSRATGAGKVKLFGESSTSSDRRSLWISECPGGAPISRSTCRYPSRSGTMIEITWTQSFMGVNYCDLGTNKEYYLNASTDATCANGGCWTRSQHYLINPLN